MEFKFLLLKLFGVSSLRALGAAFVFILGVLVTNALTVSDAGLYFWFIAVVGVLSVLSRFGLDKGYVKMGAEIDREFGGRVAIVFFVARFWVYILGCGAVVSGILFFYLKTTGNVFFNDIDAPMGVFFSSSVFLMAAVNSFGAFVIGLGSVFWGTLLISLIPQASALLLCVIVYFGLGDKLDLAFVSMSYFLGWLLSFFICILLIVVKGGGFRSVVNYLTFDSIKLGGHKALGDGAMFFALIGVLNVIEQWGATLISGLLLSAEDAAYFGVSGRLISVIQLVLVSATAAFAKGYYDKNSEDLFRYVRHSSFIVFGTGFPVVLVMFVFAPQILNLFGSGYVASADILRVMLVGQIFNLIFGVYAVVLIMNGLVRNVAICFLAAAVLFFVAVAVVYWFGYLSLFVLSLCATGGVVFQSIAMAYVYYKNKSFFVRAG